MLILKIRQAEVALADGRLDEVFELAQSPKLRSHRRGQAIVTRLVNKLVERGQEHLEAGRAMQVLADCERASKFDANLPEVIGLRSAASDAILARQREHRRNGHAIAAAREQIEAGHLAVGERLLSGAGDESRVASLLHDVNVKRSMIESQIQSCQDARWSATTWTSRRSSSPRHGRPTRPIRA